MEKSNTPFLFTMNKELRIENLFIPLKKHPKIMDEYYETIEALLR